MVNGDTIGTTIISGTQLIDGLYISKKHFFRPNEAVVRVLVKVVNPASNVRNAKIGVYTNFGSDGATVVDTSLTDVFSTRVGSDTLVNADRWFITADDAVNNNNGDPVNTSVRFGPGTIQSTPGFRYVPGQAFNNNEDDFEDTINVSISANDYVYIMEFNRLDSNLSAARTNVDKFNTVAAAKTAGYFGWMLNRELLRVVNWDLSTVVSTVSVNNPQTICPGSAYAINGNSYSAAGNYSDTLAQAFGGDSIVNTTITIAVTAAFIDQTVCPGSNYTYADGTTSTNITANESHVSTLIAASFYGCDSVVTEFISILPVYAVTVAQSVCPASDFTYADGVVSTNITANESHVSTVASSNGCDSVVTENVTVLPVYAVTVAQSVCSGSNFTYADGVISSNITANESHVSTIASSNGCDSVVTEYVTILSVSSVT